MDKRGAVYIATSERFLRDATESISSLKKNTDINVTVLTTSGLIDTARNSDNIDNVIIAQEYYDDLRDKIYNFGITPYEKTLFLDCDTLIVEDISPIFDLLDNFDIAAAYSSARERVTIDGIPESFPELSTAVVAYRSNKKTEQLFETWKEFHKKQLENGRPNETIVNKDCDKMSDMDRFGKMHGLPPFREALYDSDVKFSILPSEYNLNPTKRGYIYQTAKILHCSTRHELQDVVNRHPKPRIVLHRNSEIIWVGSSHKKTPFVDFVVQKLSLDSVTRKIGIYNPAKWIYEKIP